MIGAQVLEGRKFFFTAGKRNYRRPEALGYLNRRMSHASTGAQDQCSLSALEAASLEEPVISGDEGRSEAGRLLQRHRCGNGNKSVSRDNGFLGEATRPMAGHHAVADREAGDIIAYGGNGACRFHTRHERWLRSQLVAALTHKVVDVVDTPGLVADQHFGRSWFGRHLIPNLQFRPVGQLRAIYNLHAGSPLDTFRLCPSIPSTIWRSYRRVQRRRSSRH